MGRRSGRRNQSRKAEREALKLLAPKGDLFCEGQKPGELLDLTQEAKGQADDKELKDGDTWDTYQMVLFGYVDDDQAPDQIENINTDKERGCKTKVQSDKEDDSETCCQRRQIENEMDGEDSEVSMTDKSREKCIYFKQEKNNLMQEQEPNIQSGLSVRLMGFFRKKSRSSKREQKSKEKDRKEQEPKIEGGLFARLMGFFRKKSRSSKREQKSKEKDMKGKFKSKDSGSRPFMDVFLCCGLK